MENQRKKAEKGTETMIFPDFDILDGLDPTTGNNEKTREQLKSKDAVHFGI